MFHSLWRWLFAPRVKWVLYHFDDEGNRSTARVWLYYPDAEQITDIKAKMIRPLEELGWQVICRPRRSL